MQINCVYQKGSTGKIVYDIHRVLQKKKIESVICYGRGKRIHEHGVYKTSSEFLGKWNNLKSRFTGILYGGAFFATNRLMAIIQKEEPDVVHLHCINGYFVNIYRLLSFLKEHHYHTILTLHAEFMYTGNCGHALDCEKWLTGCGNCPRLKEATHSYFFDRTRTTWNKMKNAFEGFERMTVVSVSPWLQERAQKSPILKNFRHVTILNGIDIKNVFHPRTFSHLKERHRLGKEKILLHVTADFTSELKGGKYVIELANRLSNENIKIIVIGNTAKDLKLPGNVIDVGRVANQLELAAYYSMADLTILTSQRETFSMVCAESLACGTPVVGFKAGAPEQISIPEYSEFVEYGNLDVLQESVMEWLKKDISLDNHLSEIYSKEKMADQYIQLYENEEI